MVGRKGHGAAWMCGMGVRGGPADSVGLLRAIRMEMMQKMSLEMGEGSHPVCSQNRNQHRSFTMEGFFSLKYPFSVKTHDQGVSYALC